MASPAYIALRAAYPRLPATPTNALEEYAAAIATRDEAAVTHEENLKRITTETAALREKVAHDDPQRDKKLSDITNKAIADSDAENESYSDMKEGLDAAVDKTYGVLSPAEKAILGVAAPELVPDESALDKITKYISGLDDITKDLIVDMNNQSASTSIEIAVGYIPKTRYLKVPSFLQEKLEAAWDSQPNTTDWKNCLSAAEMIAVAAVNLSCFKDIQGAEFFAIMRAQLCAIMGIPRDVKASLVRFHEVEIVAADTSTETLRKISDWIKNNGPIMKSLRYIAINFICLSNHVILTLRSHYKNDAAFNNMWNQGFKGALIDVTLASINYDRSTFLHDVIHPWGLWKLYNAHRELAAHDICDNSMKLRLEGAASGTAAFTGAAALVDQMKATKLFDKFFESRKDAIASVKDTAEDIRKHRDMYNLNHRYYGYPNVIELPKADLQAIAPVLMAYRDVFLKNTSFKDIRAIARVAENADGVRKILVEKMKNLVKAEATKIEDLV